MSELTAKLRAYHWIVGMTFAVSLAGYPGIVASVCSVNNPATHAPCLSHPAAGRFYGGVPPAPLVAHDTADCNDVVLSEVWQACGNMYHV